jgi:hypothetical protein
MQLIGVWAVIASVMLVGIAAKWAGNPSQETAALWRLLLEWFSGACDISQVRTNKPT